MSELAKAIQEVYISDKEGQADVKSSHEAKILIENPSHPPKFSCLIITQLPRKNRSSNAQPKLQTSTYTPNPAKQRPTIRLTIWELYTNTP
jgi:hypothetical protein